MIVLGCGPSDDLGTRYHVSGTVTYKGQPLAKGRIVFVPEDPKTGRTAASDIEAGSYALTTLADTPRDGALPGKYKVSISAIEVDLSKAMSGMVKGQQGMFKQQDVAQAKQTSLIPIKYRDPELSGLTTDVQTHSNTFNFNLED
jgi:hypothetical protein